jgi:lipopolysaccharide transport system permease protein
MSSLRVQAQRSPAADRPTSRRPLWAEVWDSRSILWLLTVRDIKARYAGSMLGVMWNVIHPILMILIYILILGSILSGKFAGGGMTRGSYVVHLCAGMIPWLVFQDIVMRCSTTILENASLIKKVAFPEIILHLTVLLNALFIHFISYSAFILILLVLGSWPGAQVFACFGILAAVAVFALGAGLLASVFNIYFRDVGQLVMIGLQFLFWFTPIVYPVSLIQSQEGGAMRVLSALIEWNPLMHFARMSQWMFGAPEAGFHWASLGVVSIGPLLAFGIGFCTFNRFRHDLLDNI